MAESAEDAATLQNDQTEPENISTLAENGAAVAENRLVESSASASSSLAANAAGSKAQPGFLQNQVVDVANKRPVRPATLAKVTPRRPCRHLLPSVQRPVKPRDLLDSEWIQSQAPEPECMSDRLLDLAGVARLLRFCPTMLAPGSVAAVLQRYRQKKEPAPFMEHFEEELQAWQQSALKWLSAAQRHGLAFPVPALKLQEWIARANAMLPNPTDEVEESYKVPFSAELLESAKTVLKQKLEAERRVKDDRLVSAIGRLHINRTPGRHKGNYVSLHPSRQRRASVTHAEAQFYNELWRFGDRLEQSSQLCNASDFTKSLLSHYETLVEAWDVLDSNGNGVVDFNEFVLGCRKIHINGKLRQIFEQLSSDGVLLHLNDLDPSLKSEAQRRTIKHEMKVKQREEKRLQDLALPPVERLIKPMYSVNEDAGDFDPDTVEDFAKNRVPFGTTTSSGNKARKRGSLMMAQTTGEVRNFISQGSDRSAPLPDVAKDIHSALIKKYRTLTAAWDDLDSNEDSVLQFHEFVAGCRKLHIRGNLRLMFMELCSGKFAQVSKEDDHNAGEPHQVLQMTDLDPSMKEEADRRRNAWIERHKLHEQELQDHAEQGYHFGKRMSSSASIRSDPPEIQDGVIRRSSGSTGIINAPDRKSVV